MPSNPHLRTFATVSRTRRCSSVCKFSRDELILRVSLSLEVVGVDIPDDIEVEGRIETIS
jgi:hypothetical protein